MRRRVLLTSLAGATAGLAGCSVTTDQSTTESPTDGTTDQEPTPSTPSDDGDAPGSMEEMASVVDLKTGSRTYAFGPTRFRTHDDAVVSLQFDRTATADHPARLRGFLENANDFSNTFRVEWIPAVGRTFSSNPDGYGHEARLHLAPTEGNDLAEQAPALTRTEAGYWRLDDAGVEMPETVQLDAGERVELAYAVVGDSEMTARPTGEYEFRGDNTTASVHVWHTEQPGPTAESRFVDRSVPPLSEEVSTGWYHEADATTPVSLRPRTERLGLDGQIEFELVNHSSEELSCGHWNLHKLVDDEWYHVGPNAHTMDCRVLAPGQHHQWALRAFNGDAVASGEHSGGCGDGITRGYLGGGTYAVVAGYGYPTDRSGALIELVGEPVELQPVEDVTVTRRDATVAIEFPEYGDDEHPPDSMFTLSRTDSAEERLIAEQLMGSDGIAGPGKGLRTALAYLTADVDHVEVRADEHIVDAVTGHDDTTRQFRFLGQAYQVTQVAPSGEAQD